MFNGESNATIATRAFRRFALMAPDDFQARYDWTEHTQSEVEDIWDEVVAKVPAGATKVLELGCGGGGFAAKLKAARPDIEYIGVDLVPENIAVAEGLGLDGCSFEVGSAWEVLSDPEGDWDFIVSVACLFVYTDAMSDGLLAKLLDAAAPKGFIILLSEERQSPYNFLEPLITESNGVTESYISGDRDFLDDSLLKGLHPVYVHRESPTSTDRPQVPMSLRVMQNGSFLRSFLLSEHRHRKLLAEEVPATLSLPTIAENGRVSGFTVKAPEAAVAEKVLRTMNFED